MRTALIALLAAVAAALLLATHWTAAAPWLLLTLAVAAPLSALARALLVAVLAALVLTGTLALVAVPWLLAVVAVALAARPAWTAYRLARVGRDGLRHYPAMLWHSWRWRWLARNAHLAYIDKHHPRTLRPRIPGTTAVHVQAQPRHLMRWPRARFTVDAYGWTAAVRTVPRVGRVELANAAPWIADAWSCHRVSVTQAKPGRVVLRGLRRDPLAEPYPMAACPLEVYGSTSVPRRLYLGRDEFGGDRWLPLAGVTGITVAGLPGYGKSTLLASWLCQMTSTPAVQPAICDGKAAGDYDAWQDRAWLLAGDDLDDAQGVLEDVHAEMLARRHLVRAMTGHANGWKTGPTPDFPLLLLLLDECQTYLDVAAYKGSPKAEAAARRMVALTGSLVRKGRSVLVLVILATQKPTGDSLPTAIRDNCALSVSFALKTRDAAVAALGDSIRDYPTHCPTGHQARPEGIGVATASLRTGLDPFVRLRTPEVSEEAAAARAAAVAQHRREVERTASVEAAPRLVLAE